MSDFSLSLEEASRKIRELTRQEKRKEYLRRWRLNHPSRYKRYNGDLAECFRPFGACLCQFPVSRLSCDKDGNRELLLLCTNDKICVENCKLER